MYPHITLHLRAHALLSRQLTYLTHLRLASTTTSPSTPANPKTRPLTPPRPLPIPSKDYSPTPLSRPLGQLHPPKAGENTGIDTRPWRQRRDDFFDYDKHLARRRELTQKIAKPYFRDWSSISKDHKGKTFLAPRTLFRADKALYFPNLRGYTLRDPWRADADTCDVLMGKVSFVAVYSGQWAQRQIETFLGMDGKGEEEGLGRMVGEGLQRVEINVEEQRMRAALVWLFLGGLKKGRRDEDWARYFVVRRGLEDDVRSDLGYINGKVGYVYLVDWEGKIRWAASGEAEGSEREGLLNGARRLLEQWRKEMPVETRSEDSAKHVDAPRSDASISERLKAGVVES